jgi:hypothetical protein
VSSDRRSSQHLSGKSRLGRRSALCFLDHEPRRGQALTLAHEVAAAFELKLGASPDGSGERNSAFEDGCRMLQSAGPAPRSRSPQQPSRANLKVGRELGGPFERLGLRDESARKSGLVRGFLEGRCNQLVWTGSSLPKMPGSARTRGRGCELPVSLTPFIGGGGTVNGGLHQRMAEHESAGTLICQAARFHVVNGIRGDTDAQQKCDIGFTRRRKQHKRSPGVQVEAGSASSEGTLHQASDC